MSSSFATDVPDIPATAPPEVLEFNQQIEDTFRDLPKMWDVGAVAARQAREEGRSIFGPLQLSERAETVTADTVTGPIGIRVIRPSGERRGLFIHIHGGGFRAGSKTGVASSSRAFAGLGYVSIASQYRLTGQGRWPAQIEDVKYELTGTN